jgi:hypothetical protein
MLLVQGQYDLPSIADLLEGGPLTTRGYSHDYVPAWRMRSDLIRQPDYALLKLFGGMSTVVHQRHWPALSSLAPAARAAVLKGQEGPARMLELIESRPGITGEEIKRGLKLIDKSGVRQFQRDKTKLEQWLCVEGRDQNEIEHHTHDSAWFPWMQSKVATHGGVDPRAAVRSLMQAVYGNGAPEIERSILKAFPVWHLARAGALSRLDK